MSIVHKRFFSQLKDKCTSYTWVRNLYKQAYLNLGMKRYEFEEMIKQTPRREPTQGWLPYIFGLRQNKTKHSK